MTEVPTTAWSKDFDEDDALDGAPVFAKARVKWRKLPGLVRHVFTHFPLELSVYVGEVPARAAVPKDTRWTPIADLDGEALPSLMRKVLTRGLETPR